MASLIACDERSFERGWDHCSTAGSWTSSKVATPSSSWHGACVYGSVPRPGMLTGELALLPTALQRMRGRGWLGQSEYNFIQYFAQLGVYDRCLTTPTERSDGVGVESQDSNDVATYLFELLQFGNAHILRAKVATAGDVVAKLREGGAAHQRSKIVALWASERGLIDVVEGSYFTSPDEMEKAVVDYTLGPGCLLFLETRCGLACLPVRHVQALTSSSLAPAQRRGRIRRRPHAGIWR